MAMNETPDYKFGQLEAKVDLLLEKTKELVVANARMEAHMLRRAAVEEETYRRLTALEQDNEFVKRRLWMIAGGLSVVLIVFNTVTRFLW